MKIVHDIEEERELREAEYLAAVHEMIEAQAAAADYLLLVVVEDGVPTVVAPEYLPLAELVGTLERAKFRLMFQEEDME